MTRPLSGVRADQSRSYRDLEKFAAYVRQQLKLSIDEAVRPLELFDGLDDIQIVTSTGRTIPLRHGVVALEDSEGYARYRADQQVIEVLASEETYSGLERSLARARYFVAHELGHCVLHTDQLVRLAQMPTKQQAAFHRGKTAHRPYEDTEWQANAFASALLMPALGLLALERNLGRLTAADVSHQFAVSQQAAGYRLELFAKRRDELTRA